MNTSGDWSERFQFKPWYPRYLRFTGAIGGVPLAHKIIHKGLSTKQLPTKELLPEKAPSKIKLPF